MKIGGTHTRSIWTIGEDAFGIFDQTRLPHELVTLTLHSAEDAARVSRLWLRRASTMRFSAQRRLMAVGRVSASMSWTAVRFSSEASRRISSARP